MYHLDHEKKEIVIDPDYKSLNNIFATQEFWLKLLCFASLIAWFLISMKYG